MEPSFSRGDILILRNVTRRAEAGEIVVFKLHGKEIPIVHRILSSHFEYLKTN